MKNVIYSGWRDFIEVSEKDGKFFTNNMFSIYPSTNRMFVADDDMIITTHDDNDVYNIKKGDIVISFQVGRKFIISTINDDALKQFILDEKEKREKMLANEKANSDITESIGIKHSCDDSCDC